MIKHSVLALLIALFTNTGITKELSSPEDMQRPIRIGVLDNNPPWIYKQGNQITGIMVNRYKAMFDSLQLPIEMHGYDNLLRPINELLTGNIDIATMLFSKEFPAPPLNNVICTSQPFTKGRADFYRPLTSAHISVSDYDDLNQYKIGITRFISLEHVPYLDKENISQLKSPEYLVKMLKAKRIDIALLEKGTAIYWSNKYQIPLQKLLHVGTFDVIICISESALGEEAGESLKRRIDNYLLQNPIPDYSSLDSENILKQE